MKKLQDILRNAECDWTLDGQRMDDTEIDEAINQAAQAIEKDILGLIKDVPLDQPGDEDMDNISLQAHMIFRKGVNWQNDSLRLKLKEYLKP
jgi:hypothetical protein